MKSLLRNPKFWLAVFGVVQSLVLYFVKVPTEIWASIDALVAVVIGSLTAEEVSARLAEGIRAIGKK